jgi:hypothetical protein
VIKSILEKCLPDEVRDLVFAVRQHRRAHGEYPRILRPRTFNEKILRRKVFDRRPILTTFADKYAVREYVAQRIGPQILPNVYWLTTDPATIPFNTLPQRFVVKPTHGSGWVRVVLNKDALDRQELIGTCGKWLASSYYECLREHEYKDIPRRIMIEEFVDDGSGCAPKDYKFFTFNGKVHLIQVDGERFSGHRRSLYDRDWRDTLVQYGHEPIVTPVPRPRNLELMLRTAERLSNNLDFVRVDLYDVGRRIYFGEMTSTPGCGVERFEPRSMDECLGKLWV